MKTFAVKKKHSSPVIRRFQPSRFVYRAPELKARQAEIRRILRSTGAQAGSKPGQIPTITPSLESRIHSMKSSGQPLPESTRNYFEPRFGRDFGGIRIHSDSNAAHLAEVVNAQAFTIRSNIAFAQSRYDPATSSGKRLLAHELTHVMQQDIAKGRREHAPSLMLKKLPTYRETLESEKISKLKPDTIIKLEGLLTNPAKRQEAIDTILLESGLKGSLSGVIGGTMLYEPRLVEKCKKRKKASEKENCDNIRGQTIKDFRKPLGRDVRVEIGPKAFESVSILYSTLYHEYVHVKQRTSFGLGPGKLASEVEAYFFELKRAAVTGIAADIKEVTGNFKNLRKEYLDLKGPEKTKYKKDYDWALHETLRLLMKKISKEKDPSELRLNLAIADDFRSKVGRELSTKENAALTSLSQSKYKEYFIAESERIYSLKKPVELPVDWFNLKTSYEKLSKSDKKTMHGRYVKAFKVMFKKLVRSIMKWKPKTSSIAGVNFFRKQKLSKRRNALQRLYADLPAELKSGLKPQYETALKHLEKIEKGFK